MDHSNEKLITNSGPLKQIPNTKSVDKLSGAVNKMQLTKKSTSPTISQNQSPKIDKSHRLDGTKHINKNVPIDKSFYPKKTINLSEKYHNVHSLNKSIDTNRIVKKSTAAAADDKILQTVITNRDTGEMKIKKSTVSTIKSESIEKTVKSENSNVNNKKITDDSTGLMNKLKTFFKL